MYWSQAGERFGPKTIGWAGCLVAATAGTTVKIAATRQSAAKAYGIFANTPDGTDFRESGYFTAASSGNS